MFKEQSYLEFETVAFSVLILTEYFMTFSEINRLHWYLVICVFGSLATYIVCLFFFNDYLHVANLTVEESFFILVLFAISYIPLFLYKYYFWYLD